MNLRFFLDTLPHGGVVRFARRVNISKTYLSQLAAKQDGREPSVALAVRIHTASNGLVDLQELREDWRESWPHLAEVA